MIRSLFTTVLLSASMGCAEPATLPPIAEVRRADVDSARVLADLRHLSSPELEGRATGTPGSRAAREYIRDRMVEAGVMPAGDDWYHRFPVRTARGEVEGVNVLGLVRGTEHPDRYVVVTAHYDHLGVRSGAAYLGADDNASGTAAVLEIARYLAANPPSNSVILAALDAEELGLQGARAFVASPPVPRESVALNVNLDMVSRSEAGELYAAGTYHYPFLLPLVERVAARSEIAVLPGHDRPDLPPRDDWTMQSDHGAFHEVGIPFVYFGVEDHDDYHRPTDTFENIDPAFFVRAVATILDFVTEADRSLNEVIPLQVER
jgi:Zn-dependent M28 family amino/carboxypeptidase